MARDPNAWRDQAACLGHDPGLWCDELGHGGVPVEALRICRQCPVRDDCLDEAMTRETWNDDGVWGGTTAKAREDIRRRRIDRHEAKARGDRLADQRTESERLEQDEPWLLGETA